MVLLVTCLLHKQEALTSDLQPPRTRSDATACMYTQESRDSESRHDPGAHWLAG